MRRSLAASLFCLAAQVSAFPSADFRGAPAAEAGNQTVADATVASQLTLVPVQEPDPVVTVTVLPETESGPAVVLSPVSPAMPEAIAALPAALPMQSHPILVPTLALPVKPAPVSLNVVKHRTTLGPRAAAVPAATRLPLSRSARQQMALLASPQGASRLAEIFDQSDADIGIDPLDIHVFYSRPRLVKDEDRSEEPAAEPELSDTVRVRLFVARMKALEAQAFAKASHAAALDDEPLPEAVRLRLFLARTKALEIHRRNFS